MTTTFRNTKPIMTFICVLFFGLVGCSPPAEIGLRHPDEVLFERATYEVEQKHFEVARVTLQTLVNTYPDSEYADKARVALRDPRIAHCEGRLDLFSSECN